MFFFLPMQVIETVVKVSVSSSSTGKLLPLLFKSLMVSASLVFKDQFPTPISQVQLLPLPELLLIVFTAAAEEVVLEEGLLVTSVPSLCVPKIPPILKSKQREKEDK